MKFDTLHLNSPKDKNMGEENWYWLGKKKSANRGIHSNFEPKDLRQNPDVAHES